MLYKKPSFKTQYENYIGGKWTPPVKRQYFENSSPVDGQVFTKVPLNSETMMGAQASKDQYEKIKNYLDIGKKEGAEVLAGGDVALVKEYPHGFYIQPTVFKGHNKMRIFQEEIFGPVVSVTTFKNEADALEIATK